MVKPKTRIQALILIESSPKRGWIGEMLIKCEITIIKMNNENCQLETRSEAAFPIKGFSTFPLNSSRLRVEMYNCLLSWMRKTDKYD